MPSSQASESTPNSTFRPAKTPAFGDAFWRTWLRQPRLDVAEAVIRLRRLRGLSQAALARKLGTHQPAITRIERGRVNLGVDTLSQLAEALNATVRVDLAPMELVNQTWSVRWWERNVAEEALTPRSAQRTVIVLNNFVNQTTINLLPEASAPAYWGMAPRQEITVDPLIASEALRSGQFTIPDKTPSGTRNG